MTDKLSIADYPLAEQRPDRVRGARGKTLDDVTLDRVVAGDVEMEDLRITPDALLAQAEIARAAGRPTLAANFERASEMVKVPQQVIMEMYELLRPGRAPDKSRLDGGGAALARGVRGGAACRLSRGGGGSLRPTRAVPLQILDVPWRRESCQASSR
jgi:propanediol dehydratase small subunit